MKRLIVKCNSIFREEERMGIEAKIRREWEERKVIFIPDGYDFEIIDDGVNEAAIWLDQEIEKRKAEVPKAAVEEEEYHKETCESLQKTIVKLNEIVQEQGLKLKEYKKAAVEEKNLKFEGCITWKCPRCGYTFYNQDETASIICPNCKTKTRREHEDRQSKD